MNLKNVIRVVLLIVGMVGLFLLAPIVVALVYQEHEVVPAFAVPFVVFGGIGGGIFLRGRFREAEISPRDAPLIVTLGWVGSAVAGALPFYLSGAIPAPVDAFFESISGFTTTGATILTDIEALPRSILFWRQLTQWLGGMGIIVLVVALLPLLGWGGRHLVKAEAPWPTLEKFTPKITQTAKVLWFLYVGFTGTLVALLLAGGLDWYDALTTAFGTMPTGGYLPYSESIEHFGSAYVEVVVTVFMLLAGTNFMLYYRALRGGMAGLAPDRIESSASRRKAGGVRTAASVFFRDPEFRTYAPVFAGAALVMFGMSFLQADDGISLRHAAFQSATILTTTGFVTADYSGWHSAVQVILFLLMFVGGSAGSTGGGVKVARVHILLKQTVHELKYLVYPRGVFSLTFGGIPIRKNVVYTIGAFFVLYVFLALIGTVLVASSGTDLLSSISASLATLGNIGPGFGAVGPAHDYAFLPGYVKLGLSALMVLGRLEITTALVVLIPAFWRGR